MLYLSAPFFYLLSFTVFIYFLSPQKYKNVILLIASFYFISYFDIRNLYYLAAILLTVFFGAHLIVKYPSKSKLILTTIIISYATVFYYTKFFTYGIAIFNNLSSNNLLDSLSVFVPIGISFYILQGLGYLIDVYRGKYLPEKSIVLIALFMSYFPTIIQGPITRYPDIVSKFKKDKKLDYDSFSEGVLLIFWGAFKKLVIANRLAVFVDLIFGDYTTYYGLVILVASFAYAIQIYTDFSGAVDICKGISMLFGIKLNDNFKQPYFSKSIKEFWGKWHISLSSWLRDYIYFPLGGNRKGQKRQMINIIIVFTVSGIWHGVGFQFLLWGWLHAFYQIIPMIFKSYSKRGVLREKTIIPIILNFVLVSLTWILFRAEGTRAGLTMISSIFTRPYGLTLLRISNPYHILELVVLVISLLILFRVEIIEFRTNNNICFYLKQKLLPYRWLMYILLIVGVFVFGIYGDGYDASQFIYMQF